MQGKQGWRMNAGKMHTRAIEAIIWRNKKVKGPWLILCRLGTGLEPKYETLETTKVF